ncbi:tyrosine-type recombinase/integrase [Sporosarcina aquimarina]|uniref:tyrosine-type recombinase/integrase n=1 Tax=Sporosarcina aquimarina TaxID=114975 RepID=UPI001C8D5845|nr:tyrosine-type recombinase/integrase [Sporosarcina aquimarina]MBY0221664.1 tyrosine-type recombinase/integrase [Sporosarcina aquimarina]
MEAKKYWVSEHGGIEKKSLVILNEYLLSIKIENKAEATITKYRKMLERFLCECKIPVEEMTADIVHQWLLNFSEGKSPRTVDLMLSILSTFFTFCLDEEYMEVVVIKNRWRPVIPESLPRFLSEQQYAQAKLATEELDLRDRALVLFLFSSGCRRSEASYLTMEDLDMKKRTAKVIGKGRKIRYVHFSEECAFALDNYLQSRKDNECEYVFLNKFGDRLSDQRIYKITTRLGKKIGLLHPLNPHSCRHTFATQMLAKGAELEFIADELGHADLNTTRVYARIPSEDMMLAYQNKMG